MYVFILIHSQEFSFFSSSLFFLIKYTSILPYLLLFLGQGEGFDDNKPMYKIKDIYNVKTEIYYKNLCALSSI